MMIPMPSMSFNLNFGGKSKQLEKKDELTKSEAPLQLNYAVDPVMLLMVTALVLLSSAMLVYAARS